MQQQHRNGHVIKTKMPSITPKETDVLKLLCQGYSYTGIADTLKLDLNTVKKNEFNLRKKIGNSIEETVALAIEIGLDVTPAYGIWSPLPPWLTEFLELAVTGMTMPEISARLKISAKTVNNGFSAIYQRFGLTGQDESLTNRSCPYSKKNTAMALYLAHKREIAAV